MKFNLYSFYIIISLLSILSLEYLNEINEKLIISIASKLCNLHNTDKVIKSILSQNVHLSYYKIILIISKKEIKNINIIPKSILLLKKYNKIRLIFSDVDINLQTRLIIAIKEYPKNPILIINDDAIFPEGWLEMFINDHRKYPNDIISGSIQYFIGKNLKIKEFKEGFKGIKFGIFNHIANMIFNFAFVNTNLGGTLYPANSFKNKDFFDYQLFNTISRNSDEFWQSCFIMIENKILRQSSKIYDYTQYILLKNQSIINKEIKYKKNLIEFCKFFPKFRNIIEMRQNKILISLTSYQKRFIFLPTVIKSLRRQTMIPKKIVLVLSKKDIKNYKLKINGIDIIVVNRDLKPHKKYYYTMLKYREYAIVTVDDDIIYCRNMLKSLYNSYINHPNIVSGRRGHLMKYKKNGELKKYISWNFSYNRITEGNYDIFFTGVGGVLYPPDILNIDEKNLNIIKETILGDDITLKFLEVNKGIESKWVPNKHPQGLKIMTNLVDNPLFKINKINNDLYIKKINIDIKNLILEDWCINYKNISTGLTIYLFNIYNINKKYSFTIFNLDAYSFCPIDSRIKFIIKFDNNITNRAYCYFNSNHSLVKDNHRIFKTQKIIRAICFLNRKISNFNSFYFPKAFSKNTSNIKIYNYYKYIPFIFKQFIYIKEIKKYILKTFFYKSFDMGYNITIKMNDTKFICILYENIIYSKNEQPIFKSFICNELFNFDNNFPALDINKLNINLFKSNCFDDAIPNQFIIFNIYIEFINEINFIVIKGKFYDDLKFDIYNLKIFLIYPGRRVKCFVKSSSKYIQAYIYCNIGKNNFKEILINNQIIYSKNCHERFLLINKEIYYQNYQIIDNDIIKQNKFLLVKTIEKFDYINSIIFLIFMLAKSKIYCKNYRI